MVSSVSNSASAYASAYTSNRPPPRPSASEMAGNLFSQLDTKKQGYIEKSDLQAAFDNISGGTSASVSVDDVFSSIDSDSDGKVTKDELTTSLQNLADQLDAQFDSSRMAGAMGGMPPGPPPGGGGGGAGFSKDELQSQLDEIGSTDSKRSSLISKVVENFDEADSDSDGKVSFQEAMAYDQANPSSSASSSSSTSTASVSSSSTEETVYQRILDLLQAYAPNRSASESAASSISVTA